MASSKHRTSEDTTKLAAANNAFGVQLFNTLKENRQGKNLFFSPFSISTALTMTYVGARGDTARQMSDALQFSQVDEDQLHQAFKELTDVILGCSSGYTLTSANKLYGKANYPFTEDFLKTVEEFYRSTIEAVADFASPAVTKEINDWVSEQTKGKITNLLAPGTLDSLTRLVLINAIYFKGNWASQFQERKTKKDVFKVLDARQRVPVNLMFQSKTFPLARDTSLDCLVLDMPYKGQDLSMLVVLPNKDDGLPQLETKLSAAVLDRWSSSFRQMLVNVWMPRFKLEEMFNLNAVLGKMGMKDAFNENLANFEGISGNRELYISDVIHKAFVDVNEEGSEAAAATAVVMKARSARPREPEKPVDFRADHPFLFMIRHRRTQAILFLGRVMDAS